MEYGQGNNRWAGMGHAALHSPDRPAGAAASAFGTLPAAEQRTMVEQSHQRSASYGLDATDNPDFSPLAKPDLSGVIDQNRVLYTYALPVMETLYEQIVNTTNMVILTDAQGVIMHSLGDDDFVERANRVALTPGVAWSEQRRGTNAIGTAIAEGTPTLVHADQKSDLWAAVNSNWPDWPKEQTACKFLRNSSRLWSRRPPFRQVKSGSPARKNNRVKVRRTSKSRPASIPPPALNWLFRDGAEATDH